jgi:hypothetical protein
LEDTQENPTVASSSIMEGRNRRASLLSMIRTQAFQPWHWALVPMLAIIAYATVLRIGFLGDDIVLLAQAPGRGMDTLLPSPDSVFYRPVGMLFTWQLGWGLWGFNPLPFHIAGLMMHAAASLALGLWLAEATLKRSLGWLAGALFAVFPLHVEAVGWIAAQWDLLAVMFGLLGLWLFTIWWRRGTRMWVYALSVLCYGLGLFSKESLLTFLPVFALSAWVASPRFAKREWQRVSLALLPYAALLLLNVGMRYAVWGRIGGYPNLRTDPENLLWHGFAGHLRALVSPINGSILGEATAWVVGVVVVVSLLLGLLLHARSQWRLLLVSGALVALALLPVLNLPIKHDDLQQNRVLYLAAAGYCALVVALMHATLMATTKWRRGAFTGIALLLLLCTGLCWVHLRPWHTATVQAMEVEQDMLRLVPPPPYSRLRGMVWKVEDSPHTYKGAYLLDTALGMMRTFIANRDVPFVEPVLPASAAEYATDHRDAFALRFVYDEKLNRFRANYVAGMTWDNVPPSPSEAGDNLLLWDFRDCKADIVVAWEVRGGVAQCEPGDGLIVRPPDESLHPHMIGPPIEVRPSPGEHRFVRLRVAVRYPANPIAPTKNEWLWRGTGNEWLRGHGRDVIVKQDGLPHVYWTFLPVADVGDIISRLRFDIASGKVNAAVYWMAIDLVR